MDADGDRKPVKAVAAQATGHTPHHIAHRIRAETCCGGKTSRGPPGLIECALQTVGERVNNDNTGLRQGTLLPALANPTRITAR